MDSQIEIPTALQQLSRELGRLASGLRSLTIGLAQMVKFTKATLADGFEVSFADKELEVIVPDGAQPGLKAIQRHELLQMLYESFVEELNKVGETQRSLHAVFAELPDAILTKLPTKNGSPWRSYYLRDCLDILFEWPSEVAKTVPFLGPEIDAAGLICAASPKQNRSGFPLIERFERFHTIIEQALAEVSSLRLDFDRDAEVEEGQIKQETIKPTSDTLAVIREIQKKRSNDEIMSKFSWLSVRNLDQIRSRLKHSRYKI